MSHTPEPWRAEWQPGQTPKHTYTHCVMYGDDSLCDTLTEADAHRIVACVNACAGMADPAAEIARLSEEVDRLRRKINESVARSILGAPARTTLKPSTLSEPVIVEDTTKEAP